MKQVQKKIPLLFFALILIVLCPPSYSGLTDYIDQLLTTSYSKRVARLKDLKEIQMAGIMEESLNSEQDDSSKEKPKDFLDELDTLANDILKFLEKETYLEHSRQDSLIQIKEQILQKLE